MRWRVSVPCPVCSLEELSGESSPDGEEAFLPPVILVLDGVIDPRNFGALCRSALALGCWGVVFPKDRSAGPTPAAVKASAGAIEANPPDSSHEPVAGVGSAQGEKFLDRRSC